MRFGRIEADPQRRDRAEGGGRVFEVRQTAKDVGDPFGTTNTPYLSAALDGVRCFAVACPKDLTLYRDAVKTAGLEGRMVVKDLIELVEEAVREGTTE